MDFVTTRLQMKIGMCFLSLTLKMQGNWENWQILIVRKNLGKMTFERWSEILKFSRENVEIFCGPRTETKFVKWSASRKRLRTADLMSIPTDN